MKEDNINPALVPFDERNPHPERLYHSPSEMTDEQFAILAAAWAEGDLDSDSLSDIESIFKADPRKKSFADGFKKIRLRQGDEKWDRKNRMLRTSVLSARVRRAVTVSLAAAATVAAFFALSTFLKQQTIDITTPPPGEIEIAFARPIIRGSVNLQSRPVQRSTKKITNPVVAEEITDGLPALAYDSPVTISRDPEIIRVMKQADPFELKNMAYGIVDQLPMVYTPDENWIIRGLNAIAGVIIKDNKPVDGYMIAGACVKGVNTVLGWEMQLEKINSEAGEPVAVNFSSSLLSFRSPVKKIAAEE